MPSGGRIKDPIERAELRMQAPHEYFALAAFTIGVGTPALAAATVLEARLGWQRGLTLLVLVAVGAVVVNDPLRRWAFRRTADPARNATRILQLFLVSYIATVAVELATWWAVRPLLPGAWSQVAIVAGAIVATLVPFAVVVQVERARPKRLRQPAPPHSRAQQVDDRDPD